jgi:hypothetical protein
MAKTSSRRISRVGRQSAPGTWSPHQLMAAIRQPTLVRKLELLREVGILDATGKLASKYRSWGTRVSRTESGKALPVDGDSSRHDPLRHGR